MEFKQLTLGTPLAFEPIFAVDIVPARKIEGAINRFFMQDLKFDGYAGCTIKMDEKGQVMAIVGFRNNSKHVTKNNIPAVFQNAGIENHVRISDELKGILYGNFVESVDPADLQLQSSQGVTIIGIQLELAIRTVYGVTGNDVVLIQNIVPVGGKKNRELMINFGLIDAGRYNEVAEALGVNRNQQQGQQRDHLAESLNTKF